MLHIPPTHLLTAQTNKKDKSHRKEPTSFGKWRFRENEVRRMGQKQKRIRQKERHDWAEDEEIYIKMGSK